MPYDLASKAIAIGIVQRFGGEVSHEALVTIRQALNLPTLNKTTVWRWWAAQRGELQATPDVVQPDAPELQSVLHRIKKERAARAEQAIDAMFEQVARKMLERAGEPEVIARMHGRDLVIAAATAYDKMRLARGLPTEIVQVIPQLMQALDKLGLNAPELFNAIIAEAAALDDQR